MKTIEQLLDCIEDDIELMGENHIIYLMEEDGEVVDYDYLPSAGCNEAQTLKSLREELILKKMQENESDQTEESAKKLAVLFPGVGYTCDKPLLYYSEKMARAQGYEVIRISYGLLPEGIKGNDDKKKEALIFAVDQAGKQLQDIDLAKYSDVVFFSKSLGTIVSTMLAAKFGWKVRNVLYTPVEETFVHAALPAITFHGLEDDWVDSAEVIRLAKEKGIVMYKIEGANHSLETGNIKKDLLNLQKVCEDVQSFLLAGSKY